MYEEEKEENPVRAKSLLQPPSPVSRGRHCTPERKNNKITTSLRVLYPIRAGSGGWHSERRWQLSLSIPPWRRRAQPGSLGARPGGKGSTGPGPLPGGALRSRRDPLASFLSASAGTCIIKRLMRCIGENIIKSQHAV